LRACHASDIPFTFDALDRLDWARWTAADTHRAAADAVVETMTSSWCRFADSGDPGWPGHDTGRVQVLGPDCGVIDDPSAARRAVWSR
jgi:para-nitrobenzyl esterase